MAKKDAKPKATVDPDVELRKRHKKNRDAVIARKKARLRCAPLADRLGVAVAADEPVAGLVKELSSLAKVADLEVTHG